MATHQAKSILIRQRDNDGESNNHQQPSKIQRLESTDDDTQQPTKIIDLNDDCLMKIFGRLDLKSLFSVAVANEWLRSAAGEVYKRKFGAKKVCIGKCDDYYSAETRSSAGNAIDPKYPASKRWFHGGIVISGLKTSLQFLRCFGSSINDLKIDYNKSKSKRYQYVLQQTNNYCAKSLIEFEIWNMPNIAIEQQFQNVFSKVTTVRFEYCSLGQQWPSIIECFPNVQNLYLGYNVHCEANKTIEKSFQHLQNIHIDGWEFSSHKLIDNLLQMTRQLNSLKITTCDEFGVRMDTLLNSIKYNRSLSKLIVETHIAKTPIHSNEVQQLISNHKALIELGLHYYRFAADDAISVVRKLNSLKKFYFQMQRSDYTNLVNQLADVWTKECETWDSNYVSVKLNR